MSDWIKGRVTVAMNGYHQISCSKLIGFGETNIQVNHFLLSTYSDVSSADDFGRVMMT